MQHCGAAGAPPPPFLVLAASSADGDKWGLVALSLHRQLKTLHAYDQYCGKEEAVRLWRAVGVDTERRFCGGCRRRDPLSNTYRGARHRRTHVEAAGREESPTADKG